MVVDAMFALGDATVFSVGAELYGMDGEFIAACDGPEPGWDAYFRSADDDYQRLWTVTGSGWTSDVYASGCFDSADEALQCAVRHGLVVAR